jgi:hypothetical protein
LNRLFGVGDLAAMAVAVCAVFLPMQGAADGLPLPVGRAPAGVEEPPLPAGLGGGTAHFPGQAGAVEDSAGEPGLVRFWDTRLGIRTQGDDLVDNDYTLAETRLRLEYEQQWQQAAFILKSDLLLDALADDRGIDIEKREGWLQLREVKLGLQPHSKVDMSLGRQVLTWGTGDLIFINDLFPKDFNSFFIGRAEEYLKSPVDALRVSAYFDLLNVDLVYSPRFDSNLYLDPQRLSFFGSPGDPHLRVDTPDEWFSDDEFYVRANRRLGSWELALYGYNGFWKGPEGFDLDRQVLVFPELAVYGASARGSLAGGILNVEYGYYDSKNAGLHGKDHAPPSEQRLLLGYQRELARELTLGLQYYLTHIEDYGEYQYDRLPGSPHRDRNRHVVTARLSKLLMNQDLRLSLFAFLSPSDEDGYLRPQCHYKLDDWRSVEVGANVFFGKDNDTFFGQLRDNTNIYTAFRYDY